MAYRPFAKAQPAHAARPPTAHPYAPPPTAPTLLANRHLIEMGCALISIFPPTKDPATGKLIRGKSPSADFWNEGPAKTFNQLDAQMRTDFNIGVRLGKGSCIKVQGRNFDQPPAYLYVFDCDDHSNDDATGQRLHDELTKIYPDWQNLPRAKSGSDSPSFHIYFLSEDPDLCRNVKKIDAKKQTEIDLRANGDQTVLPPSLHSSGKRYRWLNDVPLNSPTNVLPEAVIDRMLGATKEQRKAAREKQIAEALIKNKAANERRTSLNDQPSDTLKSCLEIIGAYHAQGKELYRHTEMMAFTAAIFHDLGGCEKKNTLCDELLLTYIPRNDTSNSFYKDQKAVKFFRDLERRFGMPRNKTNDAATGDATIATLIRKRGEIMRECIREQWLKDILSKQNENELKQTAEFDREVFLLQKYSLAMTSEILNSVTPPAEPIDLSKYQFKPVYTPFTKEQK